MAVNMLIRAVLWEFSNRYVTFLSPEIQTLTKAYVIYTFYMKTLFILPNVVI